MLQWPISYYLVKCIVIGLIAYWRHRELTNICNGTCLGSKCDSSNWRGWFTACLCGLHILRWQCWEKNTCRSWLVLGHNNVYCIELQRLLIPVATSEREDLKESILFMVPPGWQTLSLACSELWSILQKDSSSFCLPVPGSLTTTISGSVSKVSYKRKYRIFGCKSWGKIPNPFRSWTKEF